MSVSVARGSRGGSAMTYTFGLSKALPFFRQNGGATATPAAHIPDPAAAKTPGLFARMLSTTGAKGADGVPTPYYHSMAMSPMYAGGYTSRDFNIFPSGAADTYVYEPSITSSKSSRYSWFDDGDRSDDDDDSSPVDSVYTYRRSVLLGVDDDDDACSVDSEEARRDPREVVPANLPSLIAPINTGIVTVPLPPPSNDSSSSSDSAATIDGPSRARTPAPAAFFSSRPPLDRHASAPLPSQPAPPPPGLAGPVYPTPATSIPHASVPVRAATYPPRVRHASTTAPFVPVPVAPTRERRTSSSSPPAPPPPPPNGSRERRTSTTTSPPRRERRTSTTAPSTSTYSPPPSAPPPPQQLPLEGLVDAPLPLARTSSLHARPLPRAPAPAESIPTLPPSRPPAPGPGSAARGVRWEADLICPSPVPFSARRKGWFNRRGDQLWTNEGGYRPALPGAEFPRDLRHYPAHGTGWMNEDGVRIDMRHRRVDGPFKSALKKSAQAMLDRGGASSGSASS